jgi:hypothetical protein
VLDRGPRAKKFLSYRVSQRPRGIVSSRVPSFQVNPPTGPHSTGDRSEEVCARTHNSSSLNALMSWTCRILTDPRNYKIVHVQHKNCKTDGKFRRPVQTLPSMTRGVCLSALAEPWGAGQALNEAGGGSESPSNSSRPASSQAPWVRGELPEEDSEEHESPPQAPDDDLASQAESGERPPGSVSEPDGQQARQRASQASRRGHRDTGAPRLAVTGTNDTVHHRVDGCKCCTCEAAAQTPQTPWTGYYSLDIEVSAGDGLGIRVTNTKHLFHELICPCGHQTGQSPYRGEDDGLWDGIGLSEWRVVGPTLCALIVALAYRGRMSRAPPGAGVPARLAGH